MLTAFLPKELCIAALGDEGKPDKRKMRVVIAGGRTTPVTLVVAAGQTIQFENHDPFPHVLYGSWGPQGPRTATEIAPKSKDNARLDAARPRQVRDPRQGDAEPALVDRRRAEDGGDRLPLRLPRTARARSRARAPSRATTPWRGYFNGEPWSASSCPEIDVAPKPAEQELKSPLVVGEGSDKSGRSPRGPGQSQGAPRAKAGQGPQAEDGN